MSTQLKTVSSQRKSLANSSFLVELSERSRTRQKKSSEQHWRRWSVMLMRNVDDVVQTSVDVTIYRLMTLLRQSRNRLETYELRLPSTRFSAIWLLAGLALSDQLTLLIQSAAPAAAYYSAPTLLLLPNNRFPPWGDRRLARPSNTVRQAGGQEKEQSLRSLASAVLYARVVVLSLGAEKSLLFAWRQSWTRRVVAGVGACRAAHYGHCWSSVAAAAACC